MVGEGGGGGWSDVDGIEGEKLESGGGLKEIWKGEKLML